MDAMGLELTEQPAVWAELWARREEVAALVGRAASPGLRRVVFAGCGDCHAAAEFGEAFLGLRSDFDVRGVPAMELSRARQFLLGPEALLVALSVSGRTPRVLEAAGAALRRGASVVALTDDPGSPLARLAPDCLVLGTSPAKTLQQTDYRDPEAARYAGYQRPVPQTKTYGAMQLGVALLCLELERRCPADRGAPRAEVERVLADLPVLAREAQVGAEAGRVELGELLRGAHLTFCGTGLNAGTARFSAYKALELNVWAAHAEIEEFCHTQYLVTGPGDAAVFLAHDRPTLERVAEIAPVVRSEVGGRTAILSTLHGSTDCGAEVVELPAVPGEVSPMLLAHASGWLVRALARGWGVNTDRFRAGEEEERYVRGSTRMIRDSKIVSDLGEGGGGEPR